MKPEIKVEGDKLTVSFDLSTGLDKNSDGEQSASIVGSVKVVLDGSEILEETAVVEWLKQKLGL